MRRTIPQEGSGGKEKPRRAGFGALRPREPLCRGARSGQPFLEGHGLDTDDSFQDVIVPFPACMASRDDSLHAKEPLGEGYELIFMFHDIPQVQVLPEDMPSVIFEQEDCSGTTSYAPW